MRLFPARMGPVVAFIAFAMAFGFNVASTMAQRMYPVSVLPDKKDGVYKIGETITWNLTVTSRATTRYTSAHYILKKCGMTVFKEGDIDLSSGSATIQSSLDEPGTIMVEVHRGASRTRIGLGGAAIAPEQIKPSLPRPDDFDAFWAAKVAELEKIPPNVQLEEADSGNPNVQYFKVTMDNVNGKHIHAQLALPKKEGKYPAILMPQWAGIYSLPKSRVVDRAKTGWIAINIMPHNLPFDQPDSYYRQQSRTLGNYAMIGAEDKDTSYFVAMYLSVYRCADYLTSRPEWDGKNLVSMGTSMGGQQTIVIGGLYPKITAILALVPSSCDVGGQTQGRLIGYPNWGDQAKKNPKILETGRYFDPVNFASHIKCPALISMGFIDETSPPAGVYTAIDQMQGTVEAFPLVDSDHQGGAPSGPRQVPYVKRAELWHKAIAAGEPVPPPLSN